MSYFLCTFADESAKVLSLGIKKRMNSFCSALVFLYLCARQITITTDETLIPYFINMLAGTDYTGAGTHRQVDDRGG